MRTGRNDPCPCGSGRKYKHCCGLLFAAAPGEGAQGLVNAANALRARRQAGEAVPLYRRALLIDPTSAEAQNNLGSALLDLGQPAAAVECYRRASELRADNAEILCNLANALRQLGQLQEAIACSERAIALDPRLSMAHNNLGLLLAGTGRPEQAVVSYRRALALTPAYVEALINLGDVLRDLGKAREALPLYRQALELDPRRADSHYRLGDLLLAMHRIDEALERLRRALALQPDHQAAQLSLGSALREQGRPAEAEASCRAALARAPDSAAALTLLGELHADRGDFAEAQRLFERAVAADPGFPFVYWSIATHRRMSRDDSEWLRSVNGLLATPLPIAHQISLHYALGKYFDDVAQYDEAFGSYRQANDLSRGIANRYVRAKLTERIEQTIRGFDASFLHRCHTRGSASELPVFIVGMPRSGTSLTEQILASHPAVFGAGEVRFWDGPFVACHKAGLGSESAARLIPELARDYLELVTARCGAALRVVDKMPANFFYAGLIHAAFPRARIIHMQRHPVDTALSIYFQNLFHVGSWANDREDLAHYYGEYVRLTRHWRATLPAQNFLEVPYEGLIEDQEGWTRRLLEFIGLPWDSRVLEFHKTERVVVTASRWQVRQRIYSGSVGRWQHYEKHLGALRQLPQLLSG
jgi:tetratricopeptide (TPR) repeat protein